MRKRTDRTRPAEGVLLFQGNSRCSSCRVRTRARVAQTVRQWWSTTVMTAAPLGRWRLDLAALSPDDFELLCAWIVAIEFPGAVHVANPDGGADSALPADGGDGWTRCWQAKRFTSTISWPQCRASLDAGVTSYGMSHYTFCFARDLTVGQQKLFEKHLRTRHRGVRVDLWDRSRLELLLFSSPQGERIANHFFNDPTLDAKALMRAIRAGGALETGEDVLDRLAAVVEHLAAGDPLYQYVQIATEADGPMPGLTPETMISMHTVRGDSRIRIDAVPRNASLIEAPPGGTMFLLREQAEEFERFLARGGDLELAGIRFEWRNMPAAFEDLTPPSEDVTLAMNAPQVVPRRWHTRISVLDSPRPAVDPIDVLLEPTLEVEADWDGALVGSYGGIDLRANFRRRVGGGGELRFDWAWRDDAARPAAERARELALVAAVKRPGRLVIEDIEDERAPAEFHLREEKLDPDFFALLSFLEDLAVLEEWTGRRFKTAARVPVSEVSAVARSPKSFGPASREWTSRTSSSSSRPSSYRRAKSTRW